MILDLVFVFISSTFSCLNCAVSANNDFRLDLPGCQHKESVYLLLAVWSEYEAHLSLQTGFLEYIVSSDLSPLSTSLSLSLFSLFDLLFPLFDDAFCSDLDDQMSSRCCAQGVNSGSYIQWVTRCPNRLHPSLIGVSTHRTLDIFNCADYKNGSYR